MEEAESTSASGSGSPSSVPAAVSGTTAAQGVLDKLAGVDTTGDDNSSAGDAASVDEGSGEDWAGLAQSSDDADGDGDQPLTPPAQSAAKPAQPPAQQPPVQQPPQPQPGVQPQQQPPAAAQPPAASPVAQPATVPAQPPVQPVTPPAPVETPEQKAAREQAERTAAEAEEKKLFDGLVQYYNLPEELAAQLPTEPEKVLPVLAAKVHQAVARSVHQLMLQYEQRMPQMLNQIQKVQESESADRKAFYDAWPALVQYEKQVLQAGALYRQLNPSATREQAIAAIGRIVSESLGITAAPPPPGQPPVAPQPPAPPASFRPAGVGTAAGGQPPASTNEFEAIAEDLLREGS